MSLKHVRKTKNKENFSFHQFAEMKMFPATYIEIERRAENAREKFSLYFTLSILLDSRNNIYIF